MPPRERKPALAALAVLLIVCGALASAYLVMASGQRVSAIQINQPVAAGQQIPVGALQEAQIGNTGISYISWSERFKVARAFAAVPLVKGALLTNGMLSSTDAAAQGRVIVGLALKSGQLPAGGLSQGQHVSLYAVGGTSDTVKPGTVLSDDAIVYEVKDGGGQNGQSSDTASISVAIPPDQAPALTQAASAGSVAVALLPTGTKVNKTQPPPVQPSVPQRSAPATGRQTGGAVPTGGTGG